MLLLDVVFVRDESALRNFFVNDITVIVIGVVIALAFLLVSVVIANLIKYKPDHRDFKKRKLWFWIMGVLALITAFVVFFFVNYFKIPEVQTTNKLAGLYNELVNHYTMLISIATGGAFVLYIVLGFILSKIFKNKKIGNWF